ncbi:hypothetical protein F383_22109 [Gossypium arboreum]|uniref:Uncharacterized protein n=1 Tax=Gossypium arboreum TaxID=29729 RepID=A0A0B0NS44_GOSAR|nr:hypothetical protein F383_22109 [Gossypium arboreum]
MPHSQVARRRVLGCAKPVGYIDLCHTAKSYARV